jgi:phosphoglucosamine mutase
MKRAYFGTDGVRGPYGGPVVNEGFFERLGVAAGRYVSRQTHAGSQQVLLGRDTRASGESLLDAAATGLASVGVEVVVLGVLPTPAVAAAVADERAALGVMITASHNPQGDNGIKFFGRGGLKLTDQQEYEIEKLIPAERPSIVCCNYRVGEGLIRYLRKTQALFPARALSGWKIVLDAANGATCVTSPVVLRELGADLVTIGDTPNGTNINDGVGSEHPEKLSAAVVANAARLGVAHDGDGDRCILCDETGEVLDGDELLTILALHGIEQGTLAEKTLVVTVQSNLGVDAAVRAAGGRVLRTAVGDRYVIERMRAEGAMLGGESSGHVVCADVSPTGDGLVAALRVMAVMRATGLPLSVLRKRLEKFPQVTSALRVREKRNLDALPHLPFAIQALERELGARGRVLVRYSGTEPKLRFLVEGPTDAVIRSALARLEAVARADLEVL